MVLAADMSRSREAVAGINAKTGMVPVLAAPMIDPGKGRVSTEIPYGLTIDQIIELVLPDRTIARDYIRVALVTAEGSQIVPPTIWGHAKPHAGVHVVIRVIPGKDFLKSILQIAVSIAALAIGSFFAPALAGALGISNGFAQGLISLGVTVLGNLLINALIPPPKPDEKQENRYSITGWRNRVDPDGAVPFAMGTIRYAPPFAALSYSEIVGDFLYIRSFFNFGYGELAMSDFRIGDTSISEYDEVDIVPRSGLASDQPVTLFPKQVIEETVGAELTYPYPRDDLGEIISDSTPIVTPVTRATGPDASSASVILAWPAGMFRTNDEGKIRSLDVLVKIEQRAIQAEEWTEVVQLNITAKQREAFYRQHTWKFSTRGRYEVRVTLLTPETTDIKKQLKVSWAALQTLRPEYPLNFGEPLALVGLRVKATHQLNGQLDNFNALVSRVCLDYNYVTGTWVKRATRNPASLFRLALQSNANPRPVPDSGIDLQQLADWHNFCRIKGLNYDRVLDDPSTSIGDVLSEIAAAGRAAKRHNGSKWGVVIDRPQELVVTHFNPRNTYGFKATRSYVRNPDGFRVKFLDASNDYKPAERLIPWPGHTSEIKLTEALELPGKTDAAEVYREARRRMFESIYRPDVYRVSQDGPIGPATRGDLVMLSQDTLERTQAVGRVKAASGRLVELDEVVTMEAGTSYAVRFRVFSDANDTIGTSIVRNVVTRSGETRLLTLTGGGAIPTAGDLCHFGIAGSDSFALVVSGIEAGQEMSCHMKLIDASPVIDQMTDALVIPAWSGRVGAEIPENFTTPATPTFTAITSGISGTDTTGSINFLIKAGKGPISIARFRVDHRLQGSTVWQSINIPAANGGGTITGYATGNIVQIRAVAVSDDGTPSAATATIVFTVGGADAAIPGALDASLISIGALLGGASVQFATSDDSLTTQVQIYRSTINVLNRATDAVKKPLAVEPSRSYAQPVGDTTRQSLLINGSFDTATAWTAGAGWSIAAGKGSHSSGSAGALSQTLSLQAGKFYRISLTASGVTGGSVTPKLAGGTDRVGTARTSNGTFSDRIQAVTGNTAFQFAASSDLVGSVDDAVVYLETATCLAQGIHYFWLEPQNQDGVPGPVAGPFAVTIK